MTEERLASHGEFLEFSGLQGLLDHYRGKDFEGNDTALVAKARQDWRKAGEEVAKEIVDKEGSPENFKPIEIERKGRKYVIYGVIHGYLGGHGDYKKFVSEPIQQADYVVFENQLNYFYKHKAGTVIPDFMVLGIMGSLFLGVHVGLFLPLHLYSILREQFGFDEEFQTDYHALDAETRRAIDIEPPLPSRIEIDIGMKAWDTGLAGIWGDPFAIVPRSLYMAGFCEGVAEAHDLKEVAIVVGDFHAMEILRFFEGRFTDHPLYLSGQVFGRRTGMAYKLAFFASKFGHLCLAGFGGMIPLVPLILILFYFLF